MLTLRDEDIISKINELGDRVALVLFPGVQYYTGQVFQMKEITTAAHNVGAYCGLDLAHATGNVVVKLHDWNVDFAVWCGYKYLNGSAGTIGGAFLHNKFNTKEFVKARGWWGHKLSTRFRMDNEWDGSGGISEFRLGNPPPLLVAAIYSSLKSRTNTFD